MYFFLYDKMFTFGSKQDKGDEPKESNEANEALPGPPAAAWAQLVLSDKPTQKTEGDKSVYDQCSAISAGLQDDEAKDLLKALVFLTSLSDKI